MFWLVLGGVSILVNVYNAVHRYKEKVNTKLQKISKYEGLIIKENVPKEDKNLDELKNNIDCDKQAAMISFAQKLESYTSEENLKVAYKNLATLELEKNKKHCKENGAEAMYNVGDNKIFYFIDESLGHEFLHSASSYFDPEANISYLGFEQENNNDGASIGRGLNEGYTELLASRIYGDEIIRCYEEQVKMARLFEFFFDDPKEMEKYYFNHDLPGFIHHLEQFAPREDIMKLLFLIDRNTFITNPPFISRYKDYQYIQCQLYDWFKNKNTDPKKLEEIEEELFENKLFSISEQNRKIKLSQENCYTGSKHEKTKRKVA